MDIFQKRVQVAIEIIFYCFRKKPGSIFFRNIIVENYFQNV